MEYKFGTVDACFRRPSFDYFKSLPVFDILSTRTSPFPNWAYLFYSLLFSVFISGLPIVLTLPLELDVFSKEHSNGWYSLSSYFVAKNLADLPANLIFPLIYATSTYFITGQIMDWWRCAAFVSIIVLIAFLSQGVGFMASAIFVDSITAATTVGLLINIPLLIFCGLLIKIESFPQILQPFTYISYFRIGLEATVSVIYAFGRCETIYKIGMSDLKEGFGDHIVPMLKCISDYDTELVGNLTMNMDGYNDMVKQSSSYALQTFDYDESNLLYNVIALFIYAMLLRISAYFILVWRIKVK